MALTENTIRTFEIGDENSVPVKASEVIYLGSAVGMTAGYARALNAGDTFAGFALEAKTGTASDGGARVCVKSAGLIQLAVTSAAVTDIGKTVYASDDGTFALTSNSGANSAIGTVHRFVSTGVAVVKFNASANGTTGIAVLTDNSAGTANDTVQALADGSTYANDVAAIRNNFADLAAKINELIVAGR